MTTYVQTSELKKAAEGVYKAAILKYLKELYAPAGDMTRNAQDGVDKVNLDQVGQSLVKYDLDPSAKQPYNVSTPEGWASFKGNFDWIKTKFDSYLTRGEVIDLESVRDPFDDAKSVLEEKGPKLDSPAKAPDDPWSGGLHEVQSAMQWAKWEGEAASNFRTEYVNKFALRHSNNIAVTEVLWHSANADLVLLSGQYSRLMAIADSTISKLLGTSGGVSLNLNSATTYRIAGAIIAVSGSVLSAGLGAPAAVSIGMAVAGSASVVAGGSFANKDGLIKEKAGPPVEISGNTCQEILQSMWDKMGEMENEVEGEITKVIDSLNKYIQAIDSGNGFEGYLVCKRPALAKGAKDIDPYID